MAIRGGFSDKRRREARLAENQENGSCGDCSRKIEEGEDWKGATAGRGDNREKGEKEGEGDREGREREEVEERRVENGHARFVHLTGEIRV